MIDNPPVPASSIQLAPPGNFDFSNANEWPMWIRRFERFRIASSLDKQSEEYQVNTFMYTVGDEAEDILSVLPLSSAQKKKYQDVKQAFEIHCVSKKNVIFERARFNKRNQEPREISELIITAVHSLAEHCAFGAPREELIRDRIVVGLRDAKLSESLQMDPELTLEKTITRVRHSEEIKRQQPVLRGSMDERQSVDIDAIRTHSKRGLKEGNKHSAHIKPGNKDRATGCGRCGNTTNHQWKDCPAKDAECRNCKRKGQFAQKCRSAGGIHDITEDSTEYDSDLSFLGEVVIDVDCVENEWTENLELNGETKEFKLDTGAGVTAIPTHHYSTEKHGILQLPKIPLYGPGRQPLEVKGYFRGRLKVRDKHTEQDIYMVNKLTKPLLGLPAIKALTLVKRVHTVQCGRRYPKALPYSLQRAGETDSTIQNRTETRCHSISFVCSTSSSPSTA